MAVDFNQNRWTPIGISIDWKPLIDDGLEVMEGLAGNVPRSYGLAFI